MKIDPRSVAILTIHGNGPFYTGDHAKRYAWPKLQLDQLRKHTPPGYSVLAYGNAVIPEHELLLRSYPEVLLRTSAEPLMRVLEHVWPIRNWLIRQAHKNFEYLVILDSDAFPIRDGWLEHFGSMLSDQKPVVAVQRLENGDSHSDRCFVMFRSEDWRRHCFDFSPMGVVDAGGGISAYLQAEGLEWHPLRRTNAWNPHQLTAGIYDGFIYHHAAGTRLPQYRSNQALWDTSEWPKEVLLHQGLMDMLFRGTSDFIEQLQGYQSPMALDQIVEIGLRAAEARPELKTILK